MSVLQKLTVRHLRANRRRTVITMVGIVLSVAMVTAVSGMVVSFQDLLYRDSVHMEGLWHVRYSGVPEEVAVQVVQEPVFSAWEWIQTEDGPVLSLLFERLHKGIFDESEAVCWKYGIEQEQVRYHNNLLIAKGIVPGNYYTALYTFAGILLVLVATGSVLVISNAFAISADQRSQQFGLLKSAGATRRQIRGMVLFEGVVLAVSSIPAGILVGILAQWVALSIANYVLSGMSTVNLSAWFRVMITPAVLAMAVVAALLTVLLAAWFPAARAAKVSAVDAIRQTRTIKLTRRQVQVSPITKALFGFEGVLAAKTMGRNRGKYRATILSLVVSIVLFIGVSSFGNILMKATSIMYEDMGSNVIVTLSGDTAQRHDELSAEIAEWEGVQAYPSRNISGVVQLPQGALSTAYQKYFPEQTPELRLFSVGGESYASLCQNLGVSPQDTIEPGAISGILVNTSGTYIRQGRRIQFEPYTIRAGDQIPIWVEGEERLLWIAATTAKIPPGIYSQYFADSLNIIVSDQVIAELWGYEKDFLWLAVQAHTPPLFVEQVQQLLEAELPFHSWSVLNYDEMAANNRNLTALVMLFVYGFIFLLTLIGITSVVTTISTSISLRAKEFAMLRAVGMTDGAIDRMLRYESWLYGVKALLWGIPLGLIACGLLYRAMTSVMDFPFIWPVTSIVISIVSILLITFGTMAFARRKQRQVNIIEALRSDAV